MAVSKALTAYWINAIGGHRSPDSPDCRPPIVFPASGRKYLLAELEKRLQNGKRPLDL
jgi:hypothetical protein